MTRSDHGLSSRQADAGARELTVTDMDTVSGGTRYISPAERAGWQWLFQNYFPLQGKVNPRYVC
jgi:hypothetical protein